MFDPSNDIKPWVPPSLPRAWDCDATEMQTLALSLYESKLVQSAAPFITEPHRRFRSRLPKTRILTNSKISTGLELQLISSSSNLHVGNLKRTKGSYPNLCPCGLDVERPRAKLSHFYNGVVLRNKRERVLGKQKNKPSVFGGSNLKKNKNAPY